MLILGNYVLGGACVSFLLRLLGDTLRGKGYMRETHTPFECGFEIGQITRIPFSLPFFYLTLIFLIFDLEIIFLLFFFKAYLMGAMSMPIIVLILFVVLLLGGLIFE